ncbi:serine/threonine receptor-like kinase NFP [Lolium rigidum]|uniref:serine/threonine receptor-like kinase NFP n=1 Tax=Lolium rigidum TaxID=89674 RepID=UPI001F5D58C8|nr:serine/threonine receptor-like kinase NFP [Lolium rigidum]
MEPRRLRFPLLLLVAVVLACRRCGAQDAPNATVPAQFACMVPTPCDTYVVYRTQSPGFLNLSVISDLFGVSRAMIVSANNLTTEDGVLLPGQPLLLPVKRGAQTHPAIPMLIPVSQRPQLPPLQYSASTRDSGAGKRSPDGVTIAVTVAVSFVAFAALCVAVFTYRRYRRRDKATVHLGNRFAANPRLCWNQKDFHSSSAIARMINNGGDKLLTSVSQFIDKPIIFGTEEIMEATMNLDERCRLGTSYYRAKLDGEVFAVKPAKGDVSAEMRMTQMVNHASLIKLAGISMGADGEYTFLVYEFAEKGSLDKWLYQKPPSSLSMPSSSSDRPVDTLLWNQRLGIAFDVANGLLYMHEHTQPSMVHGDVRARNILLTADFRAKISNFSVATPATLDAAATSSDVFAFGLLILELLSGRRAMEARVGAEIGMLWRDIRAVLEAGDKRDAKLRKWMDPTLGGVYHLDAALSLAGMARACTEEDASRRPKMADVVFSLSMLVQPLPVGDAFEKLWQPSSDENIGIVNEVAAR